MQSFDEKLEFTKVKIFKIIKWDIDKLKYKQAGMRGPTRVQRKESEKHPFRGTPKNPEKGQEWTYPRQEQTFMFKSIVI